jgi:hypothetical protein
VGGVAEDPLRELDKDFPIPSDVRSVLEGMLRRKSDHPTFYEKFCKAASKVFGKLTGRMKLSQGTVEELEEAGLNLSPLDYWAGFLLSLLSPIIICLLGWGALGFSGIYLPLGGLVVGVMAAMFFMSYPGSVANARKSDAQSKAINTIMLLAFALYHRPDLRGAVVTAADMGDGKLAEDLQVGLFEMDEHHRYETTRHLMTELAHRWGEIDEGTRLAIFDLLRSTGQEDEASRIQEISKAPGRIFESTENQLGKKLDSLIMPTMAFLVFGSLAIVLMIGLSPLFGMIGAQFVDLKFYTLVVMGLVVAFAAFTSYMGKRRPAIIPPPEIPPDDPSLPPLGKVRVLGRPIPIWVLPLTCFVAIAWPGFLYLAGVTTGTLGAIASSFSTLWLVWAAAASISLYAYLYSEPRVRLRKIEQTKLSDWGIAMNTIGSRVLDGRPMTQAMEETGALMKGSQLSNQLTDLSSTMDTLSIDLHSALFERGMAKRIYNPLITSFLGIISRIKKTSEVAAGRACMMAAEFLETLHSVERKFRDRMNEAMGNLWMVSIILLPVICAMSIWVMEFMSDVSLVMTEEAGSAGIAGVPLLFGIMETRELALVKLLMGSAALLLSLIIARYMATVRAGNDRIEFWATAGKAALASVTIFTLSYLMLGMISIS